MRRLRRTHVRSFGHGLMLAALPVVAFLGVDYLVAPPAGDGPVPEVSRPIFSNDEIATASDARRSTNGTLAVGDARQMTRPAVGEPSTGGLPAKSPNLAASIQSELKRVGCYAGEADGTWSEGTRVAMRAFNSSVRVNLATDKPDYILLTLLQGHSSKACTRSCESASVTGGACIDKSIEARALPPATLATRSAQEQFRGEARPSSVSVPGPILLSKPTPAVRPPNPGSVAAVPVNRWVGEVSAAPPATEMEPLTTSSTSRNSTAVSEAPVQPLPGRMAVGALPTPEARPGSGSATDISEARPVDRPRAVPAPTVVSRANRPERKAPERGSRLSRTFSDLTRSSP